MPLISHNDLQIIADNELYRLSDTALTQYFERDEEKLSVIYHTHVEYLIRTPRELKRIFNHLRFVLKKTKGNVSFTDLYCLSILAVKQSLIYTSIKESPGFYIGKKIDASIGYDKPEELIKNHKSKRDALLKSVDHKDIDHVNGLLNELFPLLESGGFTNYNYMDYDKSGRVASEKRLYIAMHLQVPYGFASDIDVLEFIDGTMERNEYLARSIDEGSVERVLELLQQNKKNRR
ncbi:hypothetical protein EOPP23_06330 [Endozoicomonas sp. OPT23]|nr:hypothetical protein [Endozoicomonas sp. OPT23]